MLLWKASKRAVALGVALGLGLSGCLPTPYVRTPAPRTQPTVARPVAPDAPQPSAPLFSDVVVQVQLCAGQGAVNVASSGVMTIRDGSGVRRLPAGAWRFVPGQRSPARQRWHVLTKTFQPDEETAAAAFVAARRAEGLRAELLTAGRRFQTADGQWIDNRLHWVSLGQFPDRSGAEALGKRLENAGEWTWIRPETVEPGQGVVSIRNAAGTVVEQSRLPLRIEAPQPLDIDGVQSGFWESRETAASFSGAVELRIGPDGLLEVIEIIALEAYLAGVLPAEMPSSWPLEALQAQAVAARSEALASMAGKHGLEGFDFCATEHCRAYRGHGGRTARTDEALRMTAGQVLLRDGKFVPAVFSATCGGWTEHNDNVWSGPADMALRGVPDAAPAMGTLRSPVADPAGWVRQPPQAFCAGDDRHFRWERRMSQRELSDVVNRRHAVGTVQAIECGERGVSGRLKWVRVIGSRGSQTIQKELPIRLGFGGLPSAMFIVEKQAGKDGAPVFVFSGAGRGHGVGLCQHGARGMALAGHGHAAILRHYYQNARLETLE